MRHPGSILAAYMFTDGTEAPCPPNATFPLVPAVPVDLPAPKQGPVLTDIERYKKALQKMVPKLMDYLEPKDILPALQSQGVLTMGEYDKIQYKVCRGKGLKIAMRTCWSSHF